MIGKTSAIAWLWPDGARFGRDSGVQPEGAELFALAVPANYRVGPCGPGGAPHGPREYGRSRRSDGRNPRRGKRVNRSGAIHEKKEPGTWACDLGPWQVEHTVD